jgi:hypothetical protein
MTSVAQCRGCNRTFNVDEWEALPLVGRSRFDDDEPLREYRNCSCHSTLSCVVEETTMNRYVEALLSRPIAAYGAEVMNREGGGFGYCDGAYLTNGYDYNNGPYPLTVEEAEALIAHGARDCRKS